MKKLILLFFILLLPATAVCKSSDWVEVQSVVVPKDTPLYQYYTENGNVKYILRIGDLNVPVSKANAEGYLGGIYKLEIVKWYSSITKKYKYTTRRYNPTQSDINLQDVFKSNTQTHSNHH